LPIANCQLPIQWGNEALADWGIRIVALGNCSMDAFRSSAADSIEEFVIRQRDMQESAMPQLSIGSMNWQLAIGNWQWTCALCCPTA
jgi:hypothetical protein